MRTVQHVFSRFSSQKHPTPLPLVFFVGSIALGSVAGFGGGSVRGFFAFCMLISAMELVG